MATCISYARLAVYIKRTSTGRPSWSYVAHNEKIDLIQKMFLYHEQIEVNGYEEWEDGVKWLIKDDWYSDEQIERMLALKAFA